MSSSQQPTVRRPYWNSGRAFASLDPERQGEVIGTVRSAAPLAAANRSAWAIPAAGRDWTRVQPDVESGFEGSSSGRWR